MTFRRATLLLLSLLVPAADAGAQVFVPVQPGVPVLVPNGIGFDYQRRNLRVSGFFGNGGYSVGYLPVGPRGGGFFGPPVYLGPTLPLYGYQDSINTVNIIVPTIVAPRPVPQFFTGPSVDLSGVDLDRVRPPWLEDAPPPKAPPVGAEKARVPDLPAAKKLPKPKLDEAKPPPVAPKPGKDLSEPEADPGAENLRLIKLGVQAFRDGEYGLAAHRFRQAVDAEPASGRAYFLQAQALFALGKYRESVHLIEKGLQRQADWPRTGLKPRVDMYAGHEAEYDDQLKQLDLAQLRQPASGPLLFLQGYQAWFDGRRDLALAKFRQARPLLADPSFTDSFLKAAPDKLAAR